MARRKPVSGKHRKAELQLKRAVKRGDAPAEELPKLQPRRRARPARIGPTGQPLGAPSRPIVPSSRILQSAFMKLPADFLQDAKSLASELILPRPIPSEVAILHEIDRDEEVKYGILSCPKRPKWRYDMSKKEVEKNEEGLFKKWLQETDDIVSRWRIGPPKETAGGVEAEEPATIAKPHEMPRSPTYFERNLEVWRQLWRVTEISDIILVLLDCRMPLVHYPQSLSTYLSSHKMILVLTKVDITGPARAAAWNTYLRTKHADARIVQVESFVEKEAGEGTQGRKMFEPHLPMTFRQTLVKAIMEAHAELLAPPEAVARDSAKLNHWKPRAKREIDWQKILEAEGVMVGTAVGGATAPLERQDGEDEAEPDFLTIGLIGQPNVGKSSLLNALFGTHKVRASRTPGKTKHFQTLFWTPQVRLVDCPGLVIPNFVPMEAQVLSGTLPISTIASIPSCIYYVSCLLPLELIFDLVHPSMSTPPAADKRTWRRGVPPASQSKDNAMRWTAMDILTAYAEKKQWVTAKAGRPDVMRAGNAILRAVAEGRVGWGFWPEGTPLDPDAGTGIWIPGAGGLEEDNYESEEVESHEHEGSVEAVEEFEESAGVESEEDGEEEDGEDQGYIVVSPQRAGVGRFSALALDEESSSED